MMRKAFCVFAVLCLINISMVSSEGFESPKKCAEFLFKPMQNFNKARYMGTWFMHQMYDTDGTEEYDCYVVYEKLYPNGSVNITEVLIEEGLEDDISEALMTFSTDGTGSYTYFYSDDETEYTNEYVVLKTDYYTYSVEVNCVDVGSGSVSQLYIMSRRPTVSRYTQKKINAVVKAAKLDQSAIRTLDATTCPSRVVKGKNGGGLIGGLLGLVTELLGLVTGLLGGLLG